ncbi:MAG TPA: protein kinase [Thermoanaerobaculia bacterium]
MSLSAGARLGPYEILAPLGAGGMGEVYRARDSRLSRDVALKVLPAELSSDPERLSRFEQEARSASALNHPHIVVVYDVGRSDSTAYIAMELVEGKSLRELLSGDRLPLKRTLQVAAQVADGLAKAHAAGIVHRDLKPENLMVSKDGYAKILDFGLAKLAAPLPGDVSGMPTMIREGTAPGTVLGTVGYMSPEQASGQVLDFRSDQFSFGSILYEMATGSRAFSGATAVDTMSKILHEEPKPVGALNPAAPPPFRWIVERCLAKDPDERYASTRDLARDLASVRDHISEVSGAREAMPEAPVRRRRRLFIPLAALVFTAGLAAAFLSGKSVGRTPPPSFHQLTFRRGEIVSARFAPDGQTILYTAAWDGKPIEIFVSRPESPESRPFGVSGAQVLAISGSGEIALSLNTRTVEPFFRTGTLARVSVAGGAAPREVLEDVRWADWGPDGTLAIVREAQGRTRLEFPIGKVLYETTGYVTHPRVSPSGDAVAFLDHPARNDDGGAAAIVDRSGARKTLSPLFATAWGLAWSPKGEIWFTAAAVGGNRSLYGVTRSGRTRVLSRVTGSLTLQDISRDGRVLMAHDVTHIGILALVHGEEKERDLSWLDYSVVTGISPDGGTILFNESGEGGGAGYSTYVRKTDGSPAVRLGEGIGRALSPDGKWVLAIVRPTSNAEAVLYPTGAGESRRLPAEGLNVQSGADWLPDGKKVLLTANEPGRGSRLYLQELSGGKPRAISPEGYRAVGRPVSPDGKTAAVVGPDQRIYLYPLEGGEPAAIPHLSAGDSPAGWSADGSAIYVYRQGELPAKVYLVDVATGRRELWRTLIPSDSAGVSNISRVCPTPDGKSYAYAYIRTLSDLYLVEGAR